MSRGSTRTALAWVGVAGTLGFATSAVFSSMLEFPRARFVLVHAIGALALAVVFFLQRGPHVATLVQPRPGSALAVGLLFGGILAAGVVSGPGGASPTGIRLIAALGGYGLVYGAVDALLLTIIPVLAVRARWESGRNIADRLRWGGAALAASLLVTALYHAGFTEYRGLALVQPLIGNTVVTAAYLLTGNVTTPIVAHVLMHGAAVAHGMEATAQLPPHY